MTPAGASASRFATCFLPENRLMDPRPATRSSQAPLAAAPIGVQSLDHVTLVVRDLDRTRAFYVDLWGMRQVARPGFNFPGLWFQAGDQQIHLILAHDKSSLPGLPDAPPQAGAGRVFHFAFEVADCQAAVERLKKS